MWWQRAQLFQPDTGRNDTANRAGQLAPGVTMLGHATGRLILKPMPTRWTSEAVLQAAAQTRHDDRINASPHSAGHRLDPRKRAKALGVKTGHQPGRHAMDEIALPNTG